ncbi:MAG: ASKHA domain-containing protein [Butyrivibrio sp.]|nr:ASKHA domain-containing protein [Butyrivibrio sp.]
MIKAVIKGNEGERILVAERGERLQEVLERNGIEVPLPCGGEGRCGKCRVRFLDGLPSPCSSERELLKESELEGGERLLCRTVLEADCHVDVTGVFTGLEMKILTLEEDGPDKASAEDCKKERKVGIAVDVGTTTIAAALLERSNGAVRVIKSSSIVNHQNVYGFDVISRISAAEDAECAEKMRDIVCEDIFSLIKELAAQSDANRKSVSDIDFIAVAGNTTMLHLLTGKPAEGLGKYPYKPVSLSLEHLDGSFICESLRGVRVDILPGISAFVGADIVAGIYYLKGLGEDNFMVLDLGTNGEIVFYEGGRISTASTAAGPVFEAGGISCGMASMKGAVCSVTVSKDSSYPTGLRVEYETIGKDRPKGLCGTGLMELVSELVRVGIIDGTGLIEERFFEDGFPLTEDGSIRLTQKDIRSLQLAKAAVFSGIAALLKGKTPEKLFLSGGFGNALDCERIKYLRLYPKELGERTSASGNTALKGCAGYVKAHLSGNDEGKKAEAEVKAIAGMAEVTELSAADGFNDEFIEAMNFYQTSL